MMKNLPQTLVIRHKKENLKKCSLRGLETRQDFRFLTYPLTVLPDLTGYALLTIDAPPLSKNDHSLGLLLIDATWRYAGKMEKTLPLPSHLQKRSLPPGLLTAYPRRQLDCPDPCRGLSSIEALFASYYLLERDTQGLFDHYHWKDLFLEKNRFFFPTL